MDKTLIEKLDEAASHIKVGPKPTAPSRATVIPQVAKVDTEVEDRKPEIANPKRVKLKIA